MSDTFDLLRQAEAELAAQIKDALQNDGKPRRGWASSRTADPTLADDARPITCPTCLTDLDPEGFCSCCGRVIL